MKSAIPKYIHCNSKKNQYVGFYRFPACKQWVIFDGKTLTLHQICGEHFRPDDFETCLQVEMGFGKAMCLKPGTVPTVFGKGVQPANSERCQRISKRENKKGAKKFFFTLLNELEYDGLEDLVGYICQQLHKDVPNIKVNEEEAAASYST